LLKTIDRIYFNLRNIARDPNELWHEGYAAGREVQKAATLAILEEKSLWEFSDQTLKLGYRHAVDVVRGVAK